VAVLTDTATNTATLMAVAVLPRGEPRPRKPFKNRFRAVYRPFTTVFRIAATRESPEESGTRPFLLRRAPLENGKTVSFPIRIQLLLL
jgi:hypothetical protein